MSAMGIGSFFHGFDTVAAMIGRIGAKLCAIFHAEHVIKSFSAVSTFGFITGAMLNTIF